MNARRLAAAAMIVACIGTLGGCKKAALPGTPDAGAVKGLANSANDPAVVALGRAAAACPKDKPDAHFRTLLDPECPGMKAWDKNDLIAKSANDATLLNMIEDTDPSIRFLGASALFTGGERWGSEKDAAIRVLAATETEQNKLVGYKLGLASSMIDLKKSDLTDRVIAVIRGEGRDPWLRGGVINTLAYNDPAAFPAVTEAIEGVARKDADASLRASAIHQLAGHKASMNCPFFLALVHDPASEVVSAAIHAVASNECAELHEPLEAEILRRATAGEANNETYAWALGELGKGTATTPTTPATPATKARLVAVAQEIVKNPKNAGLARSRAIDVMITLDPATPATKAFVTKYREDPDVLVAATAKKRS